VEHHHIVLGHAFEHLVRGHDFEYQKHILLRDNTINIHPDPNHATHTEARLVAVAERN